MGSQTCRRLKARWINSATTHVSQCDRSTQQASRRSASWRRRQRRPTTCTAPAKGWLASDFIMARRVRFPYVGVAFLIPSVSAARLSAIPGRGSRLWRGLT